METAESFSYEYETLSPLSTPPPPTSSTSTDFEPYVVFRNEISTVSIESPIIGTAAVDFFSLDVGEEECSASPVPAPAEPEKEVKEQERRLEGTWFRANCRFRSPMLQLHNEILDFVNFLSPTTEEVVSRNEAIKSVFDVIKYIWPNSKAEVFGSFKTGLYLPTSDVDVVILGSEVKTPKMGLLALSRALSQRQIAKNIQVIAKARVPIIKFVEKKSGISFDISFDMQNGPKAAEFIKAAVSQWAPLRPLCLILKVFLQQRELNEVYTGGVGSYALLVMLMTVLQIYHKSDGSPEHNLGVLLVNFFDLYGRKLNTSDVGVSCIQGGAFFSKIKKGFSSEGKQQLISIEDPQSTENDIGRSSFNYFMIRSAFAMAFRTLTNEKIIMDLGANRSILGTIIRPDAALLERKGGSNSDLTFKDLLPGAGDPLPQQNGEGHDIYCNWQLNNEDDENFPRNNAFSANDGLHSSGKKRKRPKDKKSVAKVKENGDQTDGAPSRKKGKKSKEKKYKQKVEENPNNRREKKGSGKEKNFWRRRQQSEHLQDSGRRNGYDRSVW